MANPYIAFYKNDPTDEGSPFAGDTDGIAVLENEPIQFSLNAKQNETKTEQLAVRTTEGYTATNVTISFLGDTDNRFSISKTADGTFSDSITFESVSSVNSVFFVKASSVDTEQRQADNSVSLNCEYGGITQNDTGTDPLESLTSQFSQFLVVHLPFNESATQDLCGNTWSVVDTSPTIIDGACNFDGNGYIYTAPPQLGSNDFTIDWWEYIPSSINTMFADTICIDGANGNAPRALDVHFPNANYPCLYVGAGTGGSWIIDHKRIGTKIRDRWVHRAIVRHNNTIYAFEDGTLYTSVSFSASINVSTSVLSLGGLSRSSRRFKGMLDNVRVFVGVALWTEDFAYQAPSALLTRLVSNPAQESTTIAQNNLTAWLPFDSSPTEDLCGNPWALTCATGIELDPTLKLPAFRVKHDVDSRQGELILYCQGMYLGGKDFLVEFDLWYMGNISFGEMYPFFIRKEAPAGSDVIKINIHEQFNDGFQRINLHAFGQQTSDISYPADQMWGHIKLMYSHASGKLTLLGTNKNNVEVTFGELDITIPRTFFTSVEIGGAYATGGTHGNAWIRNFKIYGGETALSCGTTIWLCVLHNGEVITVPLRCYEVVGSLALAVRYDGRVWYNILRSPNDTLASDIHCLSNGVEYAFSI